MSTYPIWTFPWFVYRVAQSKFGANRSRPGHNFWSNIHTDKQIEIATLYIYIDGIIFHIYYLSKEKPSNCKPKTSLKELSFCHKLKFYNLYFFETWFCIPLIFQTFKAFWSFRIYSLKYQRSTTSGCTNRNYNYWVCGKNSFPLM